MHKEFKNHLLPIALDTAVPFWIMSFLNGERELLLPGPDISTLLGEHGDALLYRVDGKTAEVFNACAKGIATCAFVPGGITVFGRHWEAFMPDDPNYDPRRPVICEMEKTAND